MIKWCHLHIGLKYLDYYLLYITALGGFPDCLRFDYKFVTLHPYFSLFSSVGPTESRFQTTAPNTNPNRTLSVPHQASTLSGKSAKLTPEILLNLASESISRVPNLVDHWISTVERINQFCDAVAPKDDESARQRFESEKQNMLADLNVIRGKNMEQISTVFDQNQKLWKVRFHGQKFTDAINPLTLYQITRFNP